MNTTSQKIVEITSNMDRAMGAAKGASNSLSIIGFLMGLQASNAVGLIENLGELLSGDGVPVPTGESTSSIPMRNAAQLNEEIKTLQTQSEAMIASIKNHGEYYLRVEVEKCCQKKWSTETFDVKRRKLLWTKMPRGPSAGAGYWSKPMPWRRIEDITRPQYEEAKNNVLKIACEKTITDNKEDIWVKSNSGIRPRRR